MPENIKTQVFNSSKKGLGSKTSEGIFRIGDSYTSYSGCDIVASVQIPKINPDGTVTSTPYVLGSLQTISISTFQDKRPVRAIGNINALEYTMGQRTIAGSLVFAVFDKHFADSIFNDLNKNDTNTLIDELPGFDITITYANEYGSMSRMALYGVRIVEEGQVVSINDVYTENTYKYCALSLERLNKNNEHSNNKMGDKRPIILNKDEASNSIDNPGKEIVDLMYGETDKLKEENIKLSVSVESPKNGHKNGIATFKLNPNQNYGEIVIYNLSGEKIKKIDVKNSSTNTSSDVYTTELQVGNYSAQYKNEAETKYSNTVYFMISKKNKNSFSSSDEPIYETSKNSIYKFLSNNKENNQYLSIEGIHNNEDLKNFIPNKKIRKNDLDMSQGNISENNSFNVELTKPNTYYTIFTYDDVNISNPKIILTERKGNELINRFIDFVRYNKNKLIYDIKDYNFILDELDKKYDYNKDLIDNILELENNKFKSEILYYSIVFQNRINRAYNYNINFFVEQDMTNQFFNSTIHNETKKTLFLKRQNEKDYVMSSKQGISFNTFLSKYNTRYFTYDITDDNYRSVKYDFVCLSPDDKYLLRKYSNITFLEDVYIDSITKSLYNKLEESELAYAQLKNNNSPNINYLEEPSFKYNYESNSLIVDIDYKDELGNNNEEYYIALKEANIIESNIPTNKIKISNNNTEVEINPFNGLILRDKYYFIWIEDKDLNVISNLAIVSTNQEEDDFIKHINKVNINEKIKKIINDANIEKNEKIYSSLLFLYSNNNINLKNLKYKIFEEVLNSTEYDIDFINKFYDLANAVLDKQIYTRNEEIYFNKKNNNISFINVDENEHIVVYKIQKAKEIDVKIYTKDENIEIDNEGYTIAFISKNKGMYRSEIILIDNRSKNYIAKNMKVSVI